MDVLEKLNRRFGAWYENLFGGRDEEELRPRDILRRILAAMEDQRREGLNGQDYVPNAYTLYIAVQDEDEREYLRAFLDANELADAVAEKIRQHGYQTRGPLIFAIQETEPTPGGERLRIRCRYEAASSEPAAPAAPEPVAPPSPAAAEPISEDLGTLPAIAPPVAILEVHNGEGRIQEIPVTATRGLRVGRSRQADNDLVLADDPMVSKRHLRIGYEHGRLILHDEGSTNGTQVRGTLVPAGQPWPLTDGDSITLGRTRIVVRLWSDSATVAAPHAAPTPAPPVALLPGETFQLLAHDGEVFPLASQMMVGRALTDDIVLIGPGVSAQHARLTAAAGVVRVEDLDSPGGTFVNGERIPPNFPVALHPGDQVAFGQVALRLAQGTPRG